MGNYNTIREFFLYLNDNSTYLILRNWDDVFNEGIYGDAHEDIDILCDDIEEFKILTGAKNIHKRNDRDNYVIQIGKMNVRFDVRHIGDEYYPAEWQRLMLQRRVRQGDIYVMGKEDYAYSLIYHALLQKPSLSEEYKNKISSSLQDLPSDNPITEDVLLDYLKSFLNSNHFKARIPSDPGVFINWKNLNYVGFKRNLKNICSRYMFRTGELIKRVRKLFG